MTLTTLLEPQSIILNVGVSSLTQVFRMMGDLTAKVCGQDCDLIVDAFLAREAEGSTAIGRGVAVPHARIEGLNRIYAVFVSLDEPIIADSVDGRPVDLYLGLLTPVGSDSEHLRTLALVTRLLRQDAIIEALRRCTDNRLAYALLTEGQAHQAA
jgi:PTS system nitrogen regulatory IIA component